MKNQRSLNDEYSVSIESIEVANPSYLAIEAQQDAELPWLRNCRNSRQLREEVTILQIHGAAQLTLAGVTCMHTMHRRIGAAEAVQDVPLVAHQSALMFKMPQ